MSNDSYEEGELPRDFQPTTQLPISHGTTWGAGYNRTVQMKSDDHCDSSSYGEPKLPKPQWSLSWHAASPSDWEYLDKGSSSSWHSQNISSSSSYNVSTPNSAVPFKSHSTNVRSNNTNHVKGFDLSNEIFQESECGKLAVDSKATPINSNSARPPLPTSPIVPYEVSKSNSDSEIDSIVNVDSVWENSIQIDREENVSRDQRCSWNFKSHSHTVLDGVSGRLGDVSQPGRSASEVLVAPKIKPKLVQLKNRRNVNSHLFAPAVPRSRNNVWKVDPIASQNDTSSDMGRRNSNPRFTDTPNKSFDRDSGCDQMYFETPKEMCVPWDEDSYAKKVCNSANAVYKPPYGTPPSPRGLKRGRRSYEMSGEGSSPIFDAQWKTDFMEMYDHPGYNFIDSHCHLDFLFRRKPFNGTFESFRNLNSDTYPSGFKGCISVFCDPRSFNTEGGLWSDLLKEEVIWGAMGCHPKNATYMTDRVFEKLKQIHLKAGPKMVALGEIGLDYSGSFHRDADVQKYWFERQLKLGIELNLPLVIHVRDAFADTYSILKKVVPSDYPMHIHCFTSNLTTASSWLKDYSNMYLGLTPLITHVYSARAKPIRLMTRHVPLDRLLLETDAPYFVPHMVPRSAMQLTHPSMAVTVAGEISSIRDEPVDRVLRQCLINTCTVYRLPGRLCS